MMMSATFRGIGLLAAAGLLLTGCAGGSGGDPEQTESSSKQIVFIPGALGNPFYVSMECGIREAADEHGFEVTIQGSPTWDASLQTPIVNGVLALDPAGVLISPTDSVAMKVPIQQVADAGVKVALVDTTLDDTSSVVTSVATDNKAGGAAAADALAELIGEEGEVMLIAFQAGASTSDHRQQGFEERIAEYPGITYLGAQISNNDPGRAASQVAATLASNPNLAGIFATNDLSTEGAATALRNADRTGQVQLVGFDAGPTQVEQLRSGQVQALIAQRPYDIGVEGVNAIAAALNDDTVEHVQTTGTVTITATNIDDPDINKALYMKTCNG